MDGSRNRPRGAGGSCCHRPSRPHRAATATHASSRPAPLQPRISSQNASSGLHCLPDSTDNKFYAYHWQKLKRWGKKIQSYTLCAHKSSLVFVGKKPPRLRVLPSFKSRVFAQRCHLTQHHLGSRLSHRGLLAENNSWHRVQARKPASNLRRWASPAVAPAALLRVGRDLAGPRGAGTALRAGTLWPPAHLPALLLLLSSRGHFHVRPPPSSSAPRASHGRDVTTPTSSLAAGTGTAGPRGAPSPGTRGGHPAGPGACPSPCQNRTPEPPQQLPAAEQALPGARAWCPTQTRNISQKQSDLKKISSAETRG